MWFNSAGRYVARNVFKQESDWQTRVLGLGQYAAPVKKTVSAPSGLLTLVLISLSAELHTLITAEEKKLRGQCPMK